MKRITLILLTLISSKSFSQSIESITKKVSNKICDCISDDIQSYSEIKPEFDRCFDKEFNQIFTLANKEEQKILVQQDALEKIKSNIIPTLNEDCEKIRKIIKSDLENNGLTTPQNPFPTNFEGKDLKNIEKLDGEIIAFNALVVKVKTNNDKPYYQVNLQGGNSIWIASLVNSGYEKKGKILRILGYVSKIENDKVAKKYNKTDYHILAFGVVDIESKQMAMFPGSEVQIKEWMNGKIPKAKR